jgi:HD-like signal output (HDOD) protein
MLIDLKDIKNYLSKVPAMPEDIRLCIKYLNDNDLKNASNSIKNNLILKKHIESIVNSAYFSLPNKVTDITQLFTLLGVETAKSIVLTHLVSLLQPKEFQIFKKLDFNSFQADFLNTLKEGIILECGESVYKKYAESLAIIPATICIIDDILSQRKDEMNLIRESSELSYGDLFYRFTKITLFGLASKVAAIWELDNDIQNVIKKSECMDCKIEEEIKKLSATIHLLLFKVVSKQEFMELNSLVRFNIQSSEIAIKNFQRMMDG